MHRTQPEARPQHEPSIELGRRASPTIRAGLTMQIESYPQVPLILNGHLVIPHIPVAWRFTALEVRGWQSVITRQLVIWAGQKITCCRQFFSFMESHNDNDAHAR